MVGRLNNGQLLPVFQLDRDFKAVLLGERLLARIASGRAKKRAANRGERPAPAPADHVPKDAADHTARRRADEGGMIFLKRHGLNGNDRPILDRLGAADLTAGVGVAAVIGTSHTEHRQGKNAYQHMSD